MSPITWGAVYLTIWWTVLFAVLPLGTVSHAEAGIDPGDGGDPGAPVDPKLKRKFLTTTIVSAVVWILLFGIVQLGIVKLPPLPRGY
jgi:predicted secreted protein